MDLNAFRHKKHNVGVHFWSSQFDVFEFFTDFKILFMSNFGEIFGLIQQDKNRDEIGKEHNKSRTNQWRKQDNIG